MEIVLTGMLVALIGGILYFAYKKEKIDRSAVVATAMIGIIFLIAGGNRWIIPPFIFFVGGSLATHYKKEKKEKLNADQKIRTWKNVGANGGAATIFAMSYISTGDPIFFIGMIASVAVAMADTLATELGQVYGENPKFLLDFFHKESGRNTSVGDAGAVSKEGFLFALMGSAMISALLIFWGYSMEIFVICLLSGFIGCVADSLLGSTLEQKGLVDTHEINLLTTLLGGFIAMMIASVFFF